MPTSERLADRVDALTRALERLEHRVERLEEGAAPGEASVREAAGAEAQEAPALVEEASGPGRGSIRGLPEALAYVGRTLLALGGAYVLRALTESGTLPPAPGVGLGLLYAIGWIALAWRASGRGRVASAVAHGSAAAAIGLPLVWETTVRFALLSPALGAVLLFAFSVLLYGVAWHRRLRSLAWIAGLGILATAMATMLGSGNLPPFVGTLVLMGGLVLATERSRGWELLAWVTAGAADIGVLVMTLISTIERSGVEPKAALASQLLLPATYLLVFGVLAVAGRRPVDPLALGQTPAAVALGLGGALVSLRHLPASFSLSVGAAALGVALAAYVVAFRVVDRARRRPFHYFGTLGTVLTIYGTGLILARPEIVWTILVPLAAGAAWRLRRLSLVLHAALYAAAAAVGSGLLAEGLRVFVTPSWEPPATMALAALAATVAALAFPPPRSPYQGPSRDAFRLVLMAIAVWGLGALAVRAGAWMLGSVSGEGVAAGTLAAVRTIVLAAAAVALALAGRWEPLRAARRLVYPLLAVGALKLGLQDFLAGEAATMVLSFLAYGTALIVAPRLRRES